MESTIKSSIDGLVAETPDRREWSLYGWAFHPAGVPHSATLVWEDREIGPVSCGWSRPDVSAALPDAPSANTGFKAHIILPQDLPAGVLDLSIVWKNSSGETVGTTIIQVDAAEPVERDENGPTAEPAIDPGNLYLDLMEKTLTGAVYLTEEEADLRRDGRDWPAYAHTMVGLARLNHLRACVETALREGIPGDFIETGVWKGGSCILVRAIFKAFGETARKVWVADSFQGLPEPNVDLYPEDDQDQHHTFEELAISKERVAGHFEKYGLLDDQVGFLEGWFKDTLPSAPEGPLSVIRLDGDMYESTMDALVNLYPRLAPGGFCIIDDYGCIEACRKAVRDYRGSHGITAPIRMIDWTGAWWRKPV